MLRRLIFHRYRDYAVHIKSCRIQSERLISVRTALFPVGGLGTRFLPATKAIPKEMLPVLDKPLIQYAVEEARDAGVERFIFVTGKGKTAIENHFDRAFECEQALIERGNTEALERLSIKGIAPGSFIFIRQNAPLGLGQAIWCARHVLNEPFAVMLADDLVVGDSPELKYLASAHAKYGGQWVSVQNVPANDVSKYGIIQGTHASDHKIDITHLVEKPSLNAAPSNTAILGRYILDPAVLDRLDTLVSDHTGNGEIQITGALCDLIPQVSLFGHPLQGTRFDCGHLGGMLEATLFLANKRPELAPLMYGKAV